MPRGIAGRGSGSCSAPPLRAAVNPRLALDLLRTGWAFRRRRWWATAPFLPTPDVTYLRWRMYTAYGSEDAVPPARGHAAVRPVAPRDDGALSSMASAPKPSTWPRVVIVGGGFAGLYAAKALRATRR